MKLVCSLLVVIVCCLSVATGDDATGSGDRSHPCPSDKGSAKGLEAPWSCPVYPIWFTGTVTYYHADYFASLPCNEPQVDLLVGDYDWPYEECGDDDCVQVGLAPAASHAEQNGQEGKDQTERHAAFPGIDEPVSENYMHVFPDGPARRYCQLNPNRKRHFLRVTVLPAKGEPEIAPFHAKLLEVQIDRKAARGKIGAFVDRRFVAFEMSGEPSGGVVTEVKATRLAGGYALRAEFDLDNGETYPTLILRAKAQEAAAGEQ